MPRDLYRVTSDGERRPTLVPFATSPISPRICSGVMAPTLSARKYSPPSLTGFSVVDEEPRFHDGRRVDLRRRRNAGADDVQVHSRSQLLAQQNGFGRLGQ